ncbi:tripartite tricarboxylate transporter substrate binding protein [Petroclostridium sp. X23]|uniref:tripartite tricarboxylate transporter substrate binding protein n=1 Tax=Petroclostridium sp. X23 TaxID=3045146 RepID=UPI0024ADC9FE|nr:tripartite tricarboxylate transporter substrate binding protein [Petroclostridium sp. X23]WHH61201.1 tripartite tricarboxylate transporter substrate binding protein [Petroclostridium sp. X23]
MNKKSVVIFCLIISLMMIAGCSSSTPASESKASESKASTPAASGESPQKEWKFERKVEIVIPFGPGSGTDTTIRAFAPLLEKEIGVPITINNVSGASGVKGAEYLNSQPADGYTYALYTPSHLIAAIAKTANFDIFNETEPVARLVFDANVIFAGKNVPYNNFKELVEYAKANPGKAKIGLMSVTGIDAVSVQELFDLAGIDVPLVPYASGAEANAGVMGGHIDMVLSSPFDANTYLESGDMKGIVILSEKRASTISDVECTKELGYEAYIGPWRGIVAKKGIPEGAIEALEAAIVKANDSKEWTDWKESVSLNDRPGFANREEFKKIWSEYYEKMKKALDK